MEIDYPLSCEEARKDLEEYMDTENRKVNIDSIKKWLLCKTFLSIVKKGTKY